MLQCTKDAPDKDAELHTLDIGEAVFFAAPPRRLGLTLVCANCGIQVQVSLTITKITAPKQDVAARTVIASSLG